MTAESGLDNHFSAGKERGLRSPRQGFLAVRNGIAQSSDCLGRPLKAERVKAKNSSSVDFIFKIQNSSESKSNRLNFYFIDFNFIKVEYTLIYLHFHYFSEEAEMSHLETAKKPWISMLWNR